MTEKGRLIILFFSCNPVKVGSALQNIYMKSILGTITVVPVVEHAVVK